MANFQRSFIKTLSSEGVSFGDDDLPIAGKTGYGNHPRDPGRETNFGVTKALARERGYLGSMCDIPYWKVLEIYKVVFWNPLYCTQIPDQAVADELFDTAVNCGPWYAVTFLQKAMNVLNNMAVLYPDVTEDGKMGPQTLKVLRQVLDLGPDTRHALLVFMNCQQGVRYMQIARENEGWEAFTKGVAKFRVKWPGAA